MSTIIIHHVLISVRGEEVGAECPSVNIVNFTVSIPPSTSSAQHEVSDSSAPFTVKQAVEQSML